MEQLKQDDADSPNPHGPGDRELSARKEMNTRTMSLSMSWLQRTHRNWCADSKMSGTPTRPFIDKTASSRVYLIRYSYGPLKWTQVLLKPLLSSSAPSLTSPSGF